MTDATLPAPEKERVVPWARIGAYGLLAVLIGFLLLGLLNAYENPVESGVAPDFTLQTFNGESITLSDLQGQVVVINFWASWCDPCREEAAYLEATWRKYEGQGVMFLGVDYVDTEREALAYLDEFDITYPNGPDLGTRISDMYNIQGVPETYFVGKDGTLRGMHSGPLYAPDLDERIEALLSE